MALIACEHVCLGYDGQDDAARRELTVSRGDLCGQRKTAPGKSTHQRDYSVSRHRARAPRSATDSCATDRLPAATGHSSSGFPASVAEVVRSGLHQPDARPRVLPRRPRPCAGESGAHGHRGSGRLQLSGALRRPAAARAARARPAPRASSSCSTRPVTRLDPVATRSCITSSSSSTSATTSPSSWSRDIDAALRYATHVHLGHQQLFYGTAADLKRSDAARAGFWEGGRYEDHSGDAVVSVFLVRARSWWACWCRCAHRFWACRSCSKRYSMIGDGLSHVGFGALAITSGVQSRAAGGGGAGRGRGGVLLLRLSQAAAQRGDAAIALLEQRTGHRRDDRIRHERHEYRCE